MTIFAADYPFLEVLWTLLVFFAWVMWFWLLIVIIGDLFRRNDIGGGKKAVWLIFLILVGFGTAATEGYGPRPAAMSG